MFLSRCKCVLTVVTLPQIEIERILYAAIFVVLWFYVHGKQLWLCWEGPLS